MIGYVSFSLLQFFALTVVQLGVTF